MRAHKSFCYILFWANLTVAHLGTLIEGNEMCTLSQFNGGDKNASNGERTRILFMRDEREKVDFCLSDRATSTSLMLPYKLWGLIWIFHFRSAHVQDNIIGFEHICLFLMILTNLT